MRFREVARSPTTWVVCFVVAILVAIIVSERLEVLEVERAKADMPPKEQVEIEIGRAIGSWEEVSSDFEGNLLKWEGRTSTVIGIRLLEPRYAYEDLARVFVPARGQVWAVTANGRYFSLWVVWDPDERRWTVTRSVQQYGKEQFIKYVIDNGWGDRLKSAGIVETQA